MVHVKNFFFLNHIKSDVKCDFRRHDDKTFLSFCHSEDKDSANPLYVMIRTETNIDHASQQGIKQHFISYVLVDGEKGPSEKAESPAIISSHLIWSFVAKVVDDTFMS